MRLSFFYYTCSLLKRNNVNFFLSLNSLEWISLQKNEIFKEVRFHLKKFKEFGIAFLQIEVIFPFFDSGGNVMKKSWGFLGFSRWLVLNTRSPIYPGPRRHGLLERLIIKVMATFQVDFRVARSERPPPGRPIMVTKGPTILLSDPFLSSLYLLCIPNRNRLSLWLLCPPPPLNNCIYSSLIFDRSISP